MISGPNAAARCFIGPLLSMIDAKKASGLSANPLNPLAIAPRILADHAAADPEVVTAGLRRGLPALWLVRQATLERLDLNRAAAVR